MPLNESVGIHELAMRKLIQDTIINRLEGSVIVLQEEKNNLKTSYEQELSLERQKTEAVTVQFEAQKGVSISHEKENKALKKENRRLKWQRNTASALGIVVIALALI